MCVKTPVDGEGLSGHACGTQQNVLSGGRSWEELTYSNSRIGGVGRRAVAGEVVVTTEQRRETAW